jgi:hypothetical protein
MTPTESLETASEMVRKVHTYEAFEDVIRLAEQDASVQTSLALFLADTTRSRREVLLACMADREFKIGEPALLEICRRLLTHADTTMRRMSALCLFSGGEAANEILSTEMSGILPKEIALDFVALFRIASGVG